MSETAVNGVEPIIFLDDVHVTFRTRTGSILHPNLVHAVQGVTIKLMPGQTIGIVGESGCGKSTTANVMCGLQAPTSGKVYFKGKDVTKRTAEDRRHMGRVISVVFQNPATALNPRMVVREQLLDPMRVHNLGTEAEQEKRVKELLELTGLPSSAAEVLPGQLSGGQRQRVAIARALSLNPDAIIADEPTSALDVSVRAQILNLLTDLKKELGLAMVFISHDIQTVRYISDDIIVMNGGKIVEQGKVVEVCAEPGEYTYDASTEPSIFAGNLGESIGEVFRNIGKRFTFGGEAPKDQRIYYFNTKELTGNKYGTPSPVPFRVVDQRAGIDIDIGIRCFGEYSYHIANPLLFYTNVCGNVTEEYTRDTLDGQLKSELLTALQPAFARISDMGIRYSALPGHTREIAAALNEELSAQWRDRRGLEIVAFGVSSVKADEADEQMIKDMQRDAAYMDPTRAAAMLSRSQGDAMKAAASNTATGPAMAFMGMGMAGQVGGVNAQDLYAMGRQQAAQQPAAPAAGSWTCACGQTGNTGKFCGNCGRPRPAAPEGWTCVCGAVNKGKFCSECGRPKPAGTPKYKCDKCGWEPDDPTRPPKFCPECGDPFDDGDIQS